MKSKKKDMCSRCDESEIKFEKSEVQVFPEICEASVDEDWSTCLKNPKHDGFIPCMEFDRNPNVHLQKANIDYNPSTVEYIKTVANLTVILYLSFISPQRSKKIDEHTGTNGNRTASGFIVNVLKDNKFPCRCKECDTLKRHKKKKNRNTCSVYIASAAHVVYNDEEAKRLIVELHYNDKERTNVKRLYGVSLCQRNGNNDSCVIECVTCDEQLANDIKLNVDNYNMLHRKFHRSAEPIAVIVSHPHGNYKHISFGKCETTRKERSMIFSLSSFQYTTMTCPGCSGAPVLLMTDTCAFRGSKLMLLNNPAHSGVNREGHNFSATHSNSTYKRRKEGKPFNGEKKRLQKETKKSEGSESALHKYYHVCIKNPGHKYFVPITEFNATHLPEGIQHEDLVEFVKRLANLTVRVAVRMTSTERPEYWPDTNDPYPFYRNRGSHVMRVGTGIIVLISQKEDVQQPLCKYRKCQNSETPRKVYYHIYMKTAAHVVFDDQEARHTTIRLFYDSDDSLSVTLDEWSVVERDITGDTCYLKCVTCDENLAVQLLEMQNRVWIMHDNIKDKYNSEKTIFILSHPHGAPKQFSVGTLKGEEILEDGYDFTSSKLSYTACTCPGSSGAPVFRLSKDCSPIIEKHIPPHVHSDALDNGLNKCSLEVENLC